MNAHQDKKEASELPVLAGERRPGRLEGKIRMSDDFDAPLPVDVRRAFGQTDR